MKKKFIIIVLLCIQYLFTEDRGEIRIAMDNYNEAFILADYDKIIENFIFPVSIITSDKMLSNTKLDFDSFQKMRLKNFIRIVNGIKLIYKLSMNIWQ